MSLTGDVARGRVRVGEIRDQYRWRRTLASMKREAYKDADRRPLELTGLQQMGIGFDFYYTDEAVEISEAEVVRALIAGENALYAMGLRSGLE